MAIDYFECIPFWCAECHTASNLTIHHIDGNPNNDSFSNLKRLCRDCHDRIHGIEDRQRLHHINKKYKRGTKKHKRK